MISTHIVLQISGGQFNDNTYNNPDLLSFNLTYKISVEKQCYECATCDNVEFKQKFEVIHHWVNNHFMDRFDYEICQWCSEIFKDMATLNNHHAEVHEKNGVPVKY